MSNYVPPSHAWITERVAGVADNLDRTRPSGGLRRNLTDGKIQRGDAFMDGLRILVDHCGPLMNKADQVNLLASYDRAADARAKLDASDVSKIQRFRDARHFKRLSKKTFQMAKRASDRALDNNLRGSFGRTGPPAPEGVSPPEPPPETGPPGGVSLAASEELGGTDPSEPHGTDLRRTDLVTLYIRGIVQAGVLPPATPEELDGTHPPAGAPPPVTPEEPDSPPPHDPGAESHATLSPGAAGVGGSTEEFRDTYSFIYNPYFASSEASIASYKTERTVNSRKSRYNTFPRRKHADSDHLGVTEGIASLNVDDASIQGGDVPTARPPPGTSLD